MIGTAVTATSPVGRAMPLRSAGGVQVHATVPAVLTATSWTVVVVVGNRIEGQGLGFRVQSQPPSGLLQVRFVHRHAHRHCSGPRIEARARSADRAIHKPRSDCSITGN